MVTNGWLQEALGITEMFGQPPRLPWDQHVYWCSSGPGVSLQFRERREITFVEIPPIVWDNGGFTHAPSAGLWLCPLRYWEMQARMAGSPWVEVVERGESKRF